VDAELIPKPTTIANHYKFFLVKQILISYSSLAFNYIISEAGLTQFL